MSVDAGGAASDHSSQIAMVGSVEIGGVADGVPELDGFERIGGIERCKVSNEIRALGHQPQMVSKASSVEGAISIHEAGEGWVESGVATEIKSNMRETVVDSDRHGRKSWARRRDEG
jgi:hypothetical protein